MARAGLIVLLAAALAGCGEASADGTATSVVGDVMTHLRVTPPKEWQRLPGVESTAATAAGKIKAAVTTVEAWGDPAAGCYAIAIDARGSVAEGVDASMARFAEALAPLGVDPEAVPKPVKDIVDAELPIATKELTGSVRIRMLRGADKRPQAVALACAANPREPERCKTQCEAMLAQMSPPTAVP
jgi:hypothetical protein